MHQGARAGTARAVEAATRVTGTTKYKRRGLTRVVGVAVVVVVVRGRTLAPEAATRWTRTARRGGKGTPGQVGRGVLRPQGCWRSCCCSCSQNFCMTSVARGRGRKKHHAQKYEGGGGESGQGCYSREGENSRARSSYSLDEDGSKRGQRHAKAGRTGRVAHSRKMRSPKGCAYLSA